MKSEAGAFDVHNVGAAKEAAEQVLLIFRGNTDAFVPDEHGGAARRTGFGLQMNRRAFVGEFDGVAEQVDEDVLYQAPVTGDLPVFGTLAMDELVFFG